MATICNYANFKGYSKIRFQLKQLTKPARPIQSVFLRHFVIVEFCKHRNWPQGKKKNGKLRKFLWFGVAFHISSAAAKLVVLCRRAAIACPNKYATIAVTLRIRRAVRQRAVLPLSRLFSRCYFTFFIAFDFHFDLGRARATLRRGCSTKLATCDNVGVKLLAWAFVLSMILLFCVARVCVVCNAGVPCVLASDWVCFRSA